MSAQDDALKALVGYSWNKDSSFNDVYGNRLDITYSFSGIQLPYWSPVEMDKKEIIPNTFGDLTPKQKEVFREQVTALWEQVANIHFSPDNLPYTVSLGNGTMAVGDIVVSGAQLGKTILGSTTKPFEVGGKVGTYGDIVIANTGNAGAENQMLERGQPGFNTLLHELGHALGLNHPVKYEPDDPDPANPMPSDPGQRYTVMSYDSVTGIDGYPGKVRSPTSWWASAPMLYDILAIQKLYGPNPTYRDGPDTYAFGTGADAIQAIWDAGDMDTIDGSHDANGNPITQSVTIDLQPGHFSFVGSSEKASKQQIAVAFEPVGSKDFDNTKCWIENAIGGDKNDTLTGNDAANTLEGGKGNDDLEGGPGNDTYPLQTTGGIDTILDHSGDNQIQIDGKAVSGVFLPTFDGGQIYYSKDKTYELRQMPDGDWRVSARNNSTGEYQAVADIDHWQSGEFGISLGTAASVDRVVLSRPNSLVSLNMDGSAATKAVQFEGGAKSDSFNGSAQSDLIDTGGGPSHYVLANGGDDKVLGGDSRDFIRTGYSVGGTTVSDNDIAFGGAQSDVLLGGYGSDQLWGNADDAGRLTFAAESSGRGDWLSGENGNDSLYGSRSSDVVFGGAGEDLLSGGAGDDLLVGDAQYAPSSGGQVFTAQFFRWDAANANMVQASGSYTLASGNAFNWEWSVAADDYTLKQIKLSSDNRLVAGGGGDVLDGGLGNDWMAGQTGDDLLDGGAGDDILYGDDKDGVVALTDQGNDTLIGNVGNDTMEGGNGADTYLFSKGDGTDTINNAHSDTSADVVEFTNVSLADVTRITRSGDDLVLNYGASDSLTVSQYFTNASYRVSQFQFANGDTLPQFSLGDSNNNTLTGTAGNDALNGLEGADTMKGGLGDDLYFVDSVDDTVIEAVNAGIDTVLSSINYTLPDNVENLGLLAGATTATGNALNNSLTGNSGNNSLNGGAGADVMAGGGGNDVYYVNHVGDSVSEVSAAGGTDVVNSTISYSLPANVENLRIQASGSVNGTGNTLNNTIYAGAGSNVMEGGTGVDTLSYSYATAGVTANLGLTAPQATGGSGTDTVLNIENLTGSRFNDLLTGGKGNNILLGGLGVDSLTGGLGADTFRFNSETETAADAQRDAVQDFNAAQGDKLGLSGIDANLAISANQAFADLTQGDAFSGTFATTASLYFDQTAQVLYGNNDADNLADFSIQLVGVTSLGTASLIL